MMIATIMNTQPKDAGGDDGMTADDIVKEKCEETLLKMPPDFIEEIFRQQVTKLKGPPNTTDKGFLAPLNIFLFQELQRLQLQAANQAVAEAARVPTPFLHQGRAPPLTNVDYHVRIDVDPSQKWSPPLFRASRTMAGFGRLVLQNSC